MSEFIDCLAVQGLRALADVSITDIGKVNLVTGRNSAGKTSLLEAIRLLVTGASIPVLSDILIRREELALSTGRFGTQPALDSAHWLSLFTGLPTAFLAYSDLVLQKIVISADGQLPSACARLELSPDWLIRRTNPDTGGITLDKRELDSFAVAEDSVPAFLATTNQSIRSIPIERLTRSSRFSLDKDSGVPACVYVGPFNAEDTGSIGALWDAIALTDLEPEVVRALQLVGEDIVGVSMIGATARGDRRIAIVKRRSHPAPVPLKTLGDGVTRLFGLILSLSAARNGVLLIDEFENGLHHSVQSKVWQTLFELAERFNVQVFATTHSWDSIQSFQFAASMSTSNGVLIRLSNDNGRVRATTFSEEELSIVTRDSIEVR